VTQPLMLKNVDSASQWSVRLTNGGTHRLIAGTKIRCQSAPHAAVTNTECPLSVEAV